MISVVPTASYVAPEHPERIVMVQKQLYASHYYDGSLAVANVIGTTEGTTPMAYPCTATAREAICSRAGSAG